MSMADPVSLQVHCASCGRPATVSYEAVPDMHPELKIWLCPYLDCTSKEVNWVRLPTKTIDTWKGHGPDPLAPQRPSRKSTD